MGPRCFEKLEAGSIPTLWSPGEGWPSTSSISSEHERRVSSQDTTSPHQHDDDPPGLLTQTRPRHTAGEQMTSKSSLRSASQRLVRKTACLRGPEVKRPSLCVESVFHNSSVHNTLFAPRVSCSPRLCQPVFSLGSGCAFVRQSHWWCRRDTNE